MANWDRTYRVQIGQAGQSGFEIGAPGGPQNMPLHVQFSIERTESKTDNTGRITIWNLNDQHAAALEEDDVVLILRAGYGDKRAMVFSGNVTKVETDLDDGDRKTTIEVSDTRVELRDTYLSLCYNGNVNTKKILDDIGDQMGVSITYSYNAEFVDIPNGFSYVGPAKNALTKLCNTSDLVWSVQFGVLQIKKQYDTLLREVYVLSPETGLIGIPKRIAVGKNDSDKKSSNGYEVKFLMNAAINIDDYVYLSSKRATGYFRVSKIQINGDNFSGDWICKAELLEA